MTLAIRRNRPDLALIARTELERRHANASRQRRLGQAKPEEAEIFARHWAAINDMAGGEAPPFVAMHFRCPASEIRWWHLCPENVEVDRFQQAALQELRRATEAECLKEYHARGKADHEQIRDRFWRLKALDSAIAEPVLGPFTFPVPKPLKEAA